jgi:NAD(P) transhydrogenase
LAPGQRGEKAAVKAAFFDYKVAIVEKSERFGGAGIQTGTLPSKTLKETALYLSGVYSKGIFSIDHELGRNAGIQDFMYRKNVVTRDAGDAIEHNLYLHKVAVYKGSAEFINDHEIRICNGSYEEKLFAKNIIIATGSYPAHPKNIPFDHIRVHDSDSILNIERFPKSLCVLGAGVIGCEYATIFAAMGIKTYMVNNSDEILGFLDREIAHALVIHMENMGIKILLNNSIEDCCVPEDPARPLILKLKNNEILECDMFLFAAGRNGNTKDLKCDRAGILLGARETVLVNDRFQTNIPHIYAVGDVIGFPALASTSMDQGRIAVAHMFQTGGLKNLATIFHMGFIRSRKFLCAGSQKNTQKVNNLIMAQANVTTGTPLAERSSVIRIMDFLNLFLTRNPE